MTQLDCYCERLGPGFWAEPLNAITNVSFVVAAWAAWSLGQRLRSLTSELCALIVLAVLIGIGSFLFHTFANAATIYMDVVPILLFQLWFLWLYSRQVIGLGIGASAGLLIGLLTTSLAGMELTEILNGSLMYAPALIILGIIGFRHLLLSQNERWSLLFAAGILFVSVCFRTIDLAVCPYFRFGTHFLWHVLNGVVVYLAMRCLILHHALCRRRSKSAVRGG